MKYSWELDDFDSEVFGFKVAKITNISPEGSVRDLIKDLIKNEVKYATYRIGSNEFQLIHSLERAGFILTDGLISFSLNISDMGAGEAAHEIREANKVDLDKLKNLTSGMYSISRVANDPITHDKANKFYAKWIENSILGKAADSVLVWEEKEEILGYVTLQKKGQIPLLGVSSASRGKGIAQKLVKATFGKFKEWGVESVTVETQMGNITALRVYQSCGFKIINSFLTLRWAVDD